MGSYKARAHAPTLQDHWWSETLTRLEENLDSLVDDFRTRLHQLEPNYFAVPEGDVQQTARDSIGALITQLAGKPVPIHLQGLAARLGVRRARQGVDRDLLLEAVRLDYRVLWAGLSRITAPEDASLLLDRAEEVLSTVESYVREVQVAFLNERDALAQTSRANETRALTHLFANEDTESAAAEVADLLGMPEDGFYEVCLIPSDHAAEARRRIASLQSTRQRFIVWEIDVGVLFIREQSRQYLQHEFAEITGVIITMIHGLSNVPAAARSAQRLLPHLAGGGLQHDHELWLPFSATVLRDQLPCLGSQELSELETLPQFERERLITNFLSYCSTGSIKDTAAATFVHRNTVVNRLRAFQEVTRLDPTVPLEAARALILIGRNVSA